MSEKPDQKELEIKWKLSKEAAKAANIWNSERSRQNARRRQAQYQRELEWYLSKQQTTQTENQPSQNEPA